MLCSSSFSPSIATYILSHVPKIPYLAILPSHNLQQQYLLSRLSVLVGRKLSWSQELPLSQWPESSSVARASIGFPKSSVHAVTVVEQCGIDMLTRICGTIINDSSRAETPYIAVGWGHMLVVLVIIACNPPTIGIRYMDKVLLRV